MKQIIPLFLIFYFVSSEKLLGLGRTGNVYIIDTTAKTETVLKNSTSYLIHEIAGPDQYAHYFTIIANNSETQVAMIDLNSGNLTTTSIIINETSVGTNTTSRGMTFDRCDNFYQTLSGTTLYKLSSYFFENEKYSIVGNSTNLLVSTVTGSVKTLDTNYYTYQTYTLIGGKIAGINLTDGATVVLYPSITEWNNKTVLSSAFCWDLLGTTAYAVSVNYDNDSSIANGIVAFDFLTESTLGIVMNLTKATDLVAIAPYNSTPTGRCNKGHFSLTIILCTLLPAAAFFGFIVLIVVLCRR